MKILQNGVLLFVHHHCKVSLFWPLYINHQCFLSFLCKLTVNVFHIIIRWVSVAFDLHFRRKKHYAPNKPYPESPPLLSLWDLHWLTTCCCYKTPHLERYHLWATLWWESARETQGGTVKCGFRRCYVIVLQPWKFCTLIFLYSITNNVQKKMANSALLRFHSQRVGHGGCLHTHRFICVSIFPSCLQIRRLNACIYMFQQIIRNWALKVHAVLSPEEYY